MANNIFIQLEVARASGVGESETGSDGEFTYQYDAEGRRSERTDIATGDRTEYDYDAAGRLTASRLYLASDPGAVRDETRTVYDAVGRRLEERELSYAQIAAPFIDRTHRFDYEGWNVASVRTDGDEIDSSYVHGLGIDQVLAEVYFHPFLGENTTVHTLADHQGSVRDFAVWNPNAGASGEIAAVGHRDYDAFGKLLDQTFASDPSSNAIEVGALVVQNHVFGYTGREITYHDDRYEYRMRSYDAASGRFLQTDPLGLRAGDTNLYRYVGNDAVNYIDPLGLEKVPTESYTQPSGTGDRHATGEVQEACTCTCVCGQMQTNANQGIQSVTPLPTFAKSAPGNPSTQLPGVGSRQPISAAGDGPNLSSFVGSNPVNTSDPTGNAAFSKDPIGFAAGDNNLFRYTGNQPVGRTDPSGLSWIIKLKVFVTETGEMVFANGKRVKLRNFDFAGKTVGFDDVLNIQRPAAKQAKMKRRIERIRQEKGDNFKITYDEYAQPDFSHCAEKSFRVPNMTGNASGDHAKAWRQLRKDLPASEFNALFKRKSSLAVHHTNDGRVLLVDKDIHDAFSHTGPASMMRASGQYSGMFFAIFAPSTGKLVEERDGGTVWEYTFAAGTDLARFFDPCVEDAYQLNQWTAEITERVTKKTARGIMLRSTYGGGNGRILLENGRFPISPRLKGGTPKVINQ